MKLRSPTVIAAMSLPISWALRAWLGTVSYRVRHDDPSVIPAEAHRRAIYVFWHEMMLVPTYTHASRRISILVSNHADGELIAQIIRMMGGSSVRGSTNKRGLTAVRNMMRRGRMNHLAITPDGPRGPRRVVQPGAIYVASRSGMPIVPVGLAYGQCWRSLSWDRMALPHPWTQGRVIIGQPIDVPARLDRGGLEHYRRIVQGALDHIQGRAEQFAAGREPAEAPQPALTLVA